jgi:hypothetical protein
VSTFKKSRTNKFIWLGFEIMCTLLYKLFSFYFYFGNVLVFLSLNKNVNNVTSKFTFHPYILSQNLIYHLKRINHIINL